MRCPKCQHNKSSVIDSRQAEDGNTIRRRRECDSCHARFTTFERVEEVPLLVVKKDGTREQFSRDKIFNGILMSAQKRPVSSEDIENAITRIEQNIRRNHDGEMVAEAPQRFAAGLDNGTRRFHAACDTALLCCGEL